MTTEQELKKTIAIYKKLRSEYKLLEKDAKKVLDEYENLHYQYETVRFFAYLLLFFIIGAGTFFQIADIDILGHYEYGEVYFGVAVFLYVILFTMADTLFQKLYMLYKKPKDVTLRNYGDDDLPDHLDD